MDRKKRTSPFLRILKTPPTISGGRLLSRMLMHHRLRHGMNGELRADGHVSAHRGRCGSRDPRRYPIHPGRVRRRHRADPVKRRD